MHNQAMTRKPTKLQLHAHRAGLAAMPIGFIIAACRTNEWCASFAGAILGYPVGFLLWLLLELNLGTPASKEQD